MARATRWARGGLALLAGALLVGCTQGGPAAEGASPAAGQSRQQSPSPSPRPSPSPDSSPAPTASPSPSSEPVAPNSRRTAPAEPTPGGGGGSSDGGGDGGGSSGGAGESSGPGAIGSPLRIPLPTDELGGFVFADRIGDVQQAIAFVCGGAQCVSVARVGLSTSLDEGESCDTIRQIQGVQKDPPEFLPYVLIAPGGTLTLVVNVRCEDVPSPAPAPPPPPAPEPGSEIPPVQPEEAPPAPEQPPVEDPPPDGDPAE
jgi:hypothetical protein